MLSQSHTLFFDYDNQLVHTILTHTHHHTYLSLKIHYDSFLAIYQTVLVSPNVAVTQSRLKILVMTAADNYQTEF